MIRLTLPVLFGTLLLAVGPAWSQTAGQPRDADSGPSPPAQAAAAPAATGTVAAISVFGTQDDVFYFRLEQMPKGINWFKATSNRSFDLVQQAADKEWTLSVWSNEKGDTSAIKAKITKESSTQTPTPPAPAR